MNLKEEICGPLNEVFGNLKPKPETMENEITKLSIEIGMTINVIQHELNKLTDLNLKVKQVLAEKGLAPQKELIAFVLPSPVPGMGGWGNGYVAIPEGHPCYEMGYDEIHDKFNISVNGGLTFAGTFNNPKLEIPKEVEGMWIVGFDTLHYGDTPERWPNEESVMKEAERLKQQLLTL